METEWSQKTFLTYTEEFMVLKGQKLNWDLDKALGLEV